jgi:hypothetical protein
MVIVQTRFRKGNIYCSNIQDQIFDLLSAYLAIALTMGFTTTIQPKGCKDVQNFKCKKRPT